MRFSAGIASLLAFSVGFAAAGSPVLDARAPGATCDAQYIVDACLHSTQPQLDNCHANDWKCMCEQSNNVLSCYNNCPGDRNQFSAQQKKNSYCNAAKAQQTTTTSSLISTTQTSSGTTATLDSPTSTSASPSSTDGSAKQQSNKNGAVGFSVQTGNLVAALAVVLGIAL